MAQTADVVVLGAGVAGCAAAYYLAREGLKVTVVERDGIGSGASGYAMGLLQPLSGAGVPGVAQPFSEASFKMHPQLWESLREEAADVDFQAGMVPHMALCMSAEDIPGQRRQMARWSEADGFSTRWLGPEEVRVMEPRIASQVVGAVLLEDLGILDSHRFTLALASAAESHGATFLTGEAVGLESEGDRLTAVTLRNGRVACASTVLALGPWSGMAADWLGMAVPIVPFKGQVLRLKELLPPLRHHLATDCAIVQKADGMVWVGSTEEEDAGFDDAVTAEARDDLIGRALEIMPAIGGLEVVRQTACLRPLSPDRLPILGRVPGWQGVYLATGAGKKGILYGPAMGRSVADLITRGKTSLPIEPFAPERFAR